MPLDGSATLVALGPASPPALLVDDDFTITPDSQTIYFTADEAGLEKIFRVSAKGGGAMDDQIEAIEHGLALLLRHAAGHGDHQLHGSPPAAPRRTWAPRRRSPSA